MRLKVPRLLVSVRSVEEAQAALDGGADIIDVKEPSRGSLGMANSKTIQDVVKVVSGRVPVSVALGDINSTFPMPELGGVTWAKQGLRGFSRAPRDSRALVSWAMLGRRIQPVRLIGVVYADHARAHSPPFDCVLDWYRRFHVEGASPPGILIDTAIKDGRGLLHWKSMCILQRYKQNCRRAGLFLALAGSLSLCEIRRLLEHVRPEIIAVRGPACEAENRNGKISRDAVNRLKKEINGSR
jgi:uncharacterized protein (UPF0264 family)